MQPSSQSSPIRKVAMALGGLSSIGILAILVAAILNATVIAEICVVVSLLLGAGTLIALVGTGIEAMLFRRSSAHADDVMVAPAAPSEPITGPLPAAHEMPVAVADPATISPATAPPPVASPAPSSPQPAGKARRITDFLTGYFKGWAVTDGSNLN